MSNATQCSNNDEPFLDVEQTWWNQRNHWQVAKLNKCHECMHLLQVWKFSDWPCTHVMNTKVLLRVWAQVSVVRQHHACACPCEAQHPTDIWHKQQLTAHNHFFSLIWSVATLWPKLKSQWRMGRSWKCRHVDLFNFHWVLDWLFCQKNSNAKSTATSPISVCCKLLPIDAGWWQTKWIAVKNIFHRTGRKQVCFKFLIRTSQHFYKFGINCPETNWKRSLECKREMIWWGKLQMNAVEAISCCPTRKKSMPTVFHLEHASWEWKKSSSLCSKNRMPTIQGIFWCLVVQQELNGNECCAGVIFLADQATTSETNASMLHSSVVDLCVPVRWQGFKINHFIGQDSALCVILCSLHCLLHSWGGNERMKRWRIVVKVGSVSWDFRKFPPSGNQDWTPECMMEDLTKWHHSSHWF